MLGLIAGADVTPRSGERIGVFAFGSGCCAEFYSGVVPDGATEVARAAGLPELLDDRYPLSIRQYEDAERERLAYIDVSTYRTSLDGFDDWYDRHYRFGKPLSYLSERQQARLLIVRSRLQDTEAGADRPAA